MTYTTYKTNLFLVVTLLFSVLAFAQEEPPISFKTHVIFDKALDARSVAVADIDGDDRIDVLSASAGDNTIRWYKNTKTDEGIVFEVNTIFNDAQFAYSVIAADIDGDMNMDVVSASLTGNTIRWYKNLGDGVFTDAEGNFTEHTIFSDATSATSVAVADINGDGRTDVVSASSGDNTIRWYENQIDIDDNVVFTEHIIYSNATSAVSVVVADINGDDRIDVVSGSAGDKTIRWYENQIDIDDNVVFTDHTIFSTPESISSVTVADIDGDMDIDVLSTSEDHNIRWHENKESVENEGSRVFTDHAINSSIVALPYAVTTGDINNDENLDVVFTSYHITSWYENNGEKMFMGPHSIDSTSAVGNYSITNADIDKDGDLDVLVALSEKHIIYWYENELLSLSVEKVLPQTTTLYPNPTSSAVNLSYTTATNTNYSLYDISGKRLATYTQSGTAHQLDVSSVSKGTYILKAISGLQVNYYRIVIE